MSLGSCANAFNRCWMMNHLTSFTHIRPHCVVWQLYSKPAHERFHLFTKYDLSGKMLALINPRIFGIPSATEPPAALKHMSCGVQTLSSELLGRC